MRSQEIIKHWLQVDGRPRRLAGQLCARKNLDGVPHEYSTESSQTSQASYMKTKDEQDLETRVRALYQLKRPALDESSRAAVEHYLDHDEFEMAFEGLCIELVKAKLLTREEAAPFIELATAVGLDKEASFDEQIIAKLKAI